MELQAKSRASGTQKQADAFKRICLVDDIKVAKLKEGGLNVQLTGKGYTIFNEIVQNARLKNGNRDYTALQELQFILALDDKVPFEFLQYKQYSEAETFKLDHGHATLYYATIVERIEPIIFEKKLVCWSAFPLLNKYKILAEVSYSTASRNFVDATLLSERFSNKFIDIISFDPAVRSALQSYL